MCACRCETKTLDNVFVNVVVSVQYQVVRDNIYDALCASWLLRLSASEGTSNLTSLCALCSYRLTDSRSQITSYVFDVVRATVPKIALDAVFTTKEEIAYGLPRSCAELE